MKVRALIVDDEPLARQRIRTLLKDEPEVDVVGECGDAASAVNEIVSLEPDLIFLDVQMPVMNGFEVLDATQDKHRPAIIFVTAYDQYAVQAFESNALDYLLKPYKRGRFSDALAKAKAQILRGQSGLENDKLVRLLEQIRSESQRLVVRSAGRVLFLRLDEIDWIEAAGNYVLLHARSEAHEIREKMNALERRLPAGRFLRIHRSYIVNLDSAQELRPCGGGEYVLALRQGKELPVGASYLKRIQFLVRPGSRP